MGKVSKALNKSGLVVTADSSPEEQAGQQQVQHIQSPRQTVYSRTSSRKNRLVNADELDTSSWEERLDFANHNITGITESIRKLRATLLYNESGNKLKSVMVLSSSPQEGKSFVCANLGISIAKSIDRQALIVDCDLRRPSLHKLFGIEKGYGIADYLDNDDSDISRSIRRTGLPRLELIPAGTPPKNPAELLSTDKMARVIEELTYRQKNRLVILDTPPFHAASETMILSKLVDKVVLVVRWGLTGRENIIKMVETIGREKIIGTVFNAFEFNILDKRIQGVGYNNYYSEYY